MHIIDKTDTELNKKRTSIVIDDIKFPGDDVKLANNI